LPLFTIANFTTFVGLLIAARKLATDPDLLNRAKALGDLAKDGKALAATLRDSGLSPLAARMKAVADEADAAFVHEGAAEARLIFWQAAPAALADPATLAATDLDAARATDAMVAAIRASAMGGDFARTPMAEQYFRVVTRPSLAALLAEASFIAGIAPALWRESLTRQGIHLETLGRIDGTTRRTEMKVDVIDERLARMEAMLLKTGDMETAQRAGLTEERILGLARRIVEDVPDLDRAFAELERAVGVAIEVQTRGHAGSNTGDFVAAVLARMAELSAEGRDTEAAAEADRAFAEWEERQKREAQKGVALLEAGLRADILRRDAVSAARRIARKVEIETQDSKSGFSILRQEYDAWYVRGRDQGLNFDLEISIEIARVRTCRARDGDQRGAALNDLGNALATLGGREAGTARLEEAVAAYRAALEEPTRERAPLDWAMAQNNLGNALWTLGERDAGTARLEEAVAAFRAALKEYTRERAPLDLAMAQNNLGNALRTLGERDAGTARLEEAVAAYRAALKEYTRERAPLDWAMAQNNLGIALRTLGERESGTTRLEEAVAALRAALEERTRERAPLDWAATQNNLGNALRTLGARETGMSCLEEAVDAYRAALEEWTRERVPLYWATTQNNLGIALATLDERESGTTRLEEAVAAFRAALEERTRDRAPLDWAATQNNLGNALTRLGARQSGTARLEEAVAAFRAALEERTRERVPLDWATTQNNLGNALRTLGGRESGTARLEEAVAAYRAALEERTRERVPLDWAMSFGNQGVALVALAERRSELATARAARDQIAEAEAVMRAGGHGPFADYYATQLPAAEALVARLSGG
jgi:tetratricopeptide (TPR) repeat protein